MCRWWERAARGGTGLQIKPVSASIMNGLPLPGGFQNGTDKDSGGATLVFTFFPLGLQGWGAGGGGEGGL